MDPRKLLIADASDDFLSALTDALANRYQIFCCQSGRQALDLLRRERCGIFVLDLVLPELDGLTLLEYAAAEGLFPRVLATTPLLSGYVQESAARLGIGYLVRKPCDISALAARVVDFGQSPQPVRLDERSYIADLLLCFGLNAKHHGYRYLFEGIFLLADSPGQAILKELYPAIAKICGRSPVNIERPMRSALDAAWEHRDRRIWQIYFPDFPIRPSSTDFICRLARTLCQYRRSGLGGASE